MSNTNQTTDHAEMTCDDEGTKLYKHPYYGYIRADFEQWELIEADRHTVARITADYNEGAYHAK